MMYCPDNYDQWKSHDTEREREFALLPKCSMCGEPIQDDYCFVIDDEAICESCMNEHFRRNTYELIG